MPSRRYWVKASAPTEIPENSFQADMTKLSSFLKPSGLIIDSVSSFLGSWQKSSQWLCLYLKLHVSFWTLTIGPHHPFPSLFWLPLRSWTDRLIRISSLRYMALTRKTLFLFCTLAATDAQQSCSSAQYSNYISSFCLLATACIMPLHWSLLNPLRLTILFLRGHNSLPAQKWPSAP